MNTPSIETGRLILRRFEERDIAALFELLSVLVPFRMYQMNFDGNAERVYSGYWDTAQVRFVEEGV